MRNVTNTVKKYNKKLWIINQEAKVKTKKLEYLILKRFLLGEEHWDLNKIKNNVAEILKKNTAAPLKVNINRVCINKKVTFIISTSVSTKEENSEKETNNNRAKILVNMYFLWGMSALIKR